MKSLLAQALSATCCGLQRSLIIALCLGLWLLPSPGRAVPLTWDVNASTSGAQDGGGTWDNQNTANWWNGTTDVQWNNANPDSATFGAASGAAGTVTLGSNITVANITFATAGSGAYTIAGGGNTLTLSNTTITLTATAGATISAYMAGTTGLTVLGGSTAYSLHLSGANTYSGTTVVGSGTSASSTVINLYLDSLNALGNSTQLTVGSASTVVINYSNATMGTGVTATVFGTGLNNGGALQGASSATDYWNGNIILGASAARVGGGVNGTLVINGVISEATAGSTVLFSRNLGATTVLNAVNTYTGDTQIYGGSATTPGTLQLGINNAISASSRLSALATASVGVENFDLNGHVQTLRGIDTNGTSVASAADLHVTNSSATPSVLTVGDTTSANTDNFAGSVQDGTGGVSLVKINGNTQILTGANTYTGSTTINSGTLQLGVNTGSSTSFVGSNGVLASQSIVVNGGTFLVDNTGTSNNNTNRLSDTGTITLNGGSFIYKGSDQASTNSSETIGTLNIGMPAPLMTLTYGSTNTVSFTAGQITRPSGGGIALINGVGLGTSSVTSSVSRFFITNAPSMVGDNTTAQNAPIIPFLLGEATSTTGGIGTATGTPDTFLTYNSTTGLRPLNPTDEFTNNSIIAGNNTRITAATTASNTTAINSLVLAATSGATLTINTGQTLTDTSGALLFATGGNTITGGTLDFGSAEAIIYFSSGANSVITSPITGSGGLTAAGGGLLAFGGQSTFSGAATFISGTVVPQVSTIGPAGAPTSGPFGTGTLVLAGAAIRATTALSATTIANNVTLAADTTIPTTGTDKPLIFSGTVTLTNGARTLTSNSTSTVTFSGVIGDGGQGYGLTIAGTGTTGAVILSANNTYSGTTTINSGRILQIGSGGGTGSFGTGPVVNNGSVVFNLNNTTSVTNNIGGSGAVTQAGSSGSVTNLSGTNTYTGATTVTKGTLNVNGTHTGGGNYTVASGATLGGSGTIGTQASSTMTIASGGTLTAGTGNGTVASFSVTLSSLTFTDSTSTMRVALIADSSPGTGTDQSNNFNTVDRLVVNGAVNLNNAQLIVSDPNNIGTSLSAGDRFDLFNWASAAPTGIFTVTAANLPTLSSGLSWDLSNLYSNGTIAVIVAPEPGRAFLLLAGLAAILMRRRRRRSTRF